MNPKPGDFPIGSPESGAAARMLATNPRDTRRRIEIVTNVHMPDPHREGPEPENRNKMQPHADPWRECLDGSLMRIVYIPSGMSEDETRRIMGR